MTPKQITELSNNDYVKLKEMYLLSEKRVIQIYKDTFYYKSKVSF